MYWYTDLVLVPLIELFESQFFLFFLFRFARNIIFNKEVFKQLVDDFFTKCSPVFISLMQIMGNNRARQREKLAHLLEEFAVLQEEVRRNIRIRFGFF